MTQTVKGNRDLKKHFFLLAALLVVLTAFLTVHDAYALPAGWSEVSIVPDGVQPDIAIDSNNKVHITYLKATPVTENQIFYITNSSGTWSTPELLGSATAPASLSPPALSLDPSNNVHVSYKYFDSFVSNALKYASKDNGAWLIADVDVVPTPGWVAGGGSSLAIDGTGKVHIAYVDGSSSEDLKYATSADRITWMTTTLAESSLAVQLTSMTTDSAGNAHVCYLANNAGLLGLYYTSNASGSWTTDLVDPDPFIGRGCSIAVDHAGTVDIAYLKNNGTDLMLAAKETGIWNSYRVAGLPGNPSEVDPHLAIGPDNGLHISYTDWLPNTNGGVKYAFSPSPSGTWTVSTISDGAGSDSAIAVGPNGNVHISYFFNNGAVRELRYATNAVTWSVNSVIPTNDCIDWMENQHQPLLQGSYVKIDGTYYYVQGSGSGSWSGTAFNGACLSQCDQLTGVAGDPAVLSPAIVGRPIELYTSWVPPSPPPTPVWSVNSLIPTNDCIDWMENQHQPLLQGSYVKIDGTYYYVQGSGSGSWSGTAFNGACLSQCDQLTGTPGGPAVLSPAVVGQPIELFTSWVAPSPGWKVYSVSPTNAACIDWVNSQHQPLVHGSYVKLNDIYYSVLASGTGSWSGTTFNGACLAQADQLTGTPGAPAVLSPAVVGQSVEVYTSWVSIPPSSGWTVTSVYSSNDCIDWNVSKHEPLVHGNYITLNSIFYYVQASGSASWNGAAFNWACLSQSDQVTGAPGARAVLSSAVVGQPIRLYASIPPEGACGDPGSPVAVAPGGQGPSINASGEMVWSQFDPATGHWQLVSSVSGTITSDPVDHLASSINRYGDIVWAQTYNNGSQMVTNIWGRITGTIVQLTNGTQDRLPSINDNGEVVYVSNNQIYSTLRGQLTFDANERNSSGINNNGDVVWDQYDPVTGTTQIYKLAYGSSVPMVVTSGPVWHLMPSISDSGVMVWSQGTPTGELRLYSSQSGNVTQVTFACPTGDHGESRINSCGDIVFTSHGQNGPTVYRLGNNSPCRTDGSFTVTPSAGPNGTIDPPAPQTVNYYTRSAVFTVTPSPGYRLSSVTGCNGTLNGNTYTTGPITADCTVSAAFTDMYSLTVTKDGTGSGTVKSATSDINCGGACVAPFPPGTLVSLIAVPDPGSVFVGWSGDGCSGIGTCATSIDADKTVTATFSQYITLTAPNGGEILRRGSTYKIQWNYANRPGTAVRIDLLKGGVLYRSIMANAPIGSNGSGFYNWLVPGSVAPGPDYTIRINNNAYSSYRDTSNANFTIQ